ncbi:gliding motility protein [Flavobacterium agricola]|uniref:Gliding motility protein n=1 Tax=Flavobacterium agricola TaxID=2870839 RepID=A0ABY6LZB6_9FLAO|nr:gliding motility protein [Flavobacterium agricola]UYW00897.1 gliding motility protein [Flavobacterium agricola]
MKQFSLKILIPIALAWVVIACSTKRDTLLNRKFQALTTEYNVLFNGQEAFNKYHEELINSFVDNYWEVLPIEPFVAKDEFEAPSGEQTGQNLSVPEDKATKAIQKHSMYINGQERNPQADEAYLLLGKTRYYDNRFLPAIEAFNYVIYKSPEANTLNEIVVWRERAHIQLDNNEQAIANLKELLETTDQKDFKKEVFVDANAVLAQAYYNTQVIDTAITKLTVARNLTRDNEKKARFSFILGQLHNKFNQPDSANYYFQEVINMKRKAKRMYTMQAYAQQANLFDYEKGDTIAFLKKFNALLADRENRPYLYILNHQLGNFYNHYHDYKKAIAYYNASIKQNNGKDRYLQASNYRELGQINFEERDFKTSAKYYDSSLVNLPNPSKEYLTIQRKLKNIGEVIKYEDMITVADSTIRIYNMTEPERVAYFSGYIEELKEKDTEAALKAIEQAKKQNNIAAAQQQQQAINNLASQSTNNFQPPGAEMMPPPGFDADQNTFYYYIPQSVQQGKLNFERRWGKRPLKDNWRWLANVSNTGAIAANENITISVDSTLTEKGEKPLLDLSLPKYDLQTYLDKVVTDPEAIAELEKNRNAAYYELGYIYDDKFGEYQLAADRLESLLASNPEKGLLLPTYYNLYKIYTKLNSPKALVYQNKIMTEYPDTHYAKVLQGLVAEKTDDPEAVYTVVYKEYLDKNDPELALEQVKEKIDFYTGTPIISKFELLKARLLAKIYGVTAYKQALTEIEDLYPLTEEGKEAKRILETEIPSLEAYEFSDKDLNKWLLVYQLPKNDTKQIEGLVQTIQKYITQTHNASLKVTVDYYNPEITLVVVHGFYSDARARQMDMLLHEKEYKVKLNGLPMSLHNYIVIQTHKNLDSYKIK